MWYHYLLILAGLYLVGSAIYTIVTGPKSITSMAMTGVQGVIGAAIGYYGYSGTITPAPSMFPSVQPAVNTMMGGVRRMITGKR